MNKSDGQWTPVARRTLLWGVLVPILLIVMFLTCLFLPFRKVTVGEVTDDVSKNLPLGSSTADIVAFLEDRDIGFSEPAPRSNFGVITGGDDLPEDTAIIAAIIRDTSYPYRIQMHVQIYFILDDHGALARVEVEEREDFF